MAVYEYKHNTVRTIIKLRFFGLMTTAIVPRYASGAKNNKLFEFDDYDVLETYGPVRNMFQALRSIFKSHNEDIATIDSLDLDSFDTCIFLDMDYDYLSRVISRPDPPTIIYMMYEPPSVVSENTSSHLVQLSPLFDAILTWNPALSGVEGFWEYNFPQYFEDTKVESEYHDRKILLTNISSRKFSEHPDELYSEREKIIQYYDENHPDEFSLFGQYWNQRPRPKDIFNHQQLSYNHYQTYRGMADSKAEVYKQHRFALCFENMTGIDGYVTEKIFDCFRSGIVPIYWGAEDITDYVPPETFVDYRKFGSPESLHGYIRSIDRTEYMEYVNAAKQFLASDPNALTPTRNAETIYQVVSEARNENISSYPSSLLNEIHFKGERARLIKQSAKYQLSMYISEMAKTVKKSRTFKNASSIVVRSLWNRYSQKLTL